MKKHGLYKHPLYKRWMSMRNRCNNPNHNGYHNYGGRGISVCAEWDDFSAFVSWSEANGWEPGLVLDRTDVNGNYEPSNCRWITQKRNCNNTRFNIRYLCNGEMLTLPEASEKTGIGLPCLVSRIYMHKWPIERAFIAPTAAKGEKHHSAKLKAEQVLKIKELASSGLSCPEIAKRYCISPDSIEKILKGKTWKHLQSLLIT